MSSKKGLHCVLNRYEGDLLSSISFLAFFFLLSCLCLCVDAEKTSTLLLVLCSFGRSLPDFFLLHYCDLFDIVIASSVNEREERETDGYETSRVDSTRSDPNLV